MDYSTIPPEDELSCAMVENDDTISSTEMKWALLSELDMRRRKSQSAEPKPMAMMVYPSALALSADLMASLGLSHTPSVRMIIVFLRSFSFFSMS